MCIVFLQCGEVRKRGQKRAAAAPEQDAGRWFVTASVLGTEAREQVLLPAGLFFQSTLHGFLYVLEYT